MILLIKCLWHKNQKCAPKASNLLLQDLTRNKKIENEEVKINITTNQQHLIAPKAKLVSIPEVPKVQAPNKSDNLPLQEVTPKKKIKNEEVKIDINTNQHDSNCS